MIPLATSAAGDAELDRATMRGLKAVNVVIDRIDPQLPKEACRRKHCRSGSRRG